MTPDEIQAEIQCAELRLIPIEDLAADEDNPRKNDRAAKQLADTVALTGWGAPPLVQADGLNLIAGHTRIKAALRLGLNVLPCLVLDVDDKRAAALALADNRVAELASWDNPKLALKLNDFTIPEAEQMGFDHKFLEKIGANLDPGEEGAKVDEVPSAPKEPVSKEGDIWTLGRHTLIVADSLSDEAREQIIEHAPAALMTDPPFAIYGSSTGIGSDIADDKMVRPFFEGVFRQGYSCLPYGAHFFVHTDWRSWAAMFDSAKRIGVSCKNMVVWDKGSGGLGNYFANSHELIFFGVKLRPPKAMKSCELNPDQRFVHTSNILRFNRVTGNERLHNAAKPVQMLIDIMALCSDEGDTILDLFGGSGSTMIAAEKTDRACIMFEMEPKNADIIVRRWQDLTGQKAKR